jgi:hypothetical protein
MKWYRLFCCALFVSVALFSFDQQASGQFLDHFNDPTVKLDPQGLNGWLFRAGDGTATMDFRQTEASVASILVDATTDKRGIWWALIER